MKKTILTAALAIALAYSESHAQSHVMSQRDQAEVIDQWLNDKLDSVLPKLMRREGIDMWFVVSREYNEDPVIRTLLPATWHAARRRTMLLLYDQGEGKGVEKLAVARYDVGKAFKKSWDPEETPDQWEQLTKLIEERNPSKIAVNMADNYGHADGLNATEYNLLMEYLPENLKDKVVSAENLAVGWLETRTVAEMATYRHIVGLAHEIIAEGLSEKVITPGVTTTDDVVWWYRERIKELKLDTWFHPTVDIQRSESEKTLKSFASRPEAEVIMPGDLLHMDFGITYLRLNTDTQQLAYVLKPGETEVPSYLEDALKVGNRLQDILTSQFETGRSGNEILRRSLEIAEKENIKATIYTHPIGYHGHAAGPTIGMWDNQGDTPGSGDYPLYPNTAFSIELNAEVFITEWDKDVRIMLEEEAIYDGEKVTYINGRQTKIMPIPRRSTHLNP
ncbi:M24 family metallopeptidase [Litoribacter alkaliphilus]|uniref:M24 family metallopeptidase n=1 Tax=Litoribacter ruber TaxID=702568 RepID=A0AAP2CGN0_9BACT|nr:M24 family metallopeptidase [Litoribacter alkaliphilus]MBS9522836.1 M24 family metallopeptidase [Litoribacter alkaliphilus]